MALKPITRSIHTLAVIALLLTPLGAAIGATATQTNSGQGLEISPPVIELNADPGQSVTASIKIRNVTPGDLIVHGQADDFTADGENGNPKILLDEKEATRYSLKFWIASVPTLQLVTGEIKTVSVKIDVPKNAEPGGHYGVVRFTGNPPSLEGTGVALNASIGALILLRVSGIQTEQANVVDFSVQKNGTSSGFFENGPLNLSERLHNTGTVHVKPTGSIQIFDTVGKKVATLAVNDPARNILPGSVRRFDEPWTKKWLFGHYKATIHLTYGTTGKSLDSTVGFWVIPYKLILLSLLILIGLILALRWGIRRYNQHIIASAAKPRK